MRLFVRSEHRQGAGSARVLRTLAAAFLRASGRPGVELSIVVTTNRRIRALNRRWREKDTPTDVLSFPAAPGPVSPGRDRPLGDVVISLDTARRRAREDGRALRAELARYLAHGLLHLLGHDHQTPRGAGRMALAEEKLLGRAGLVGEE